MQPNINDKFLLAKVGTLSSARSCSSFCQICHIRLAFRRWFRHRFHSQMFRSVACLRFRFLEMNKKELFFFLSNDRLFDCLDRLVFVCLLFFSIHLHTMVITTNTPIAATAATVASFHFTFFVLHSQSFDITPDRTRPLPSLPSLGFSSLNVVSFSLSWYTLLWLWLHLSTDLLFSLSLSVLHPQPMYEPPPPSLLDLFS